MDAGEETIIDGLVKSPISLLFVIPANAGIQLFQLVLDSGFHRSDGFGTFYEFIMSYASHYINILTLSSSLHYPCLRFRHQTIDFRHQTKQIHL